MKSTLIILFTLISMQASFAQAKQDAYVKVDKMPEFPGGQVALVKYLSKNIKYPANSKKNKIKGKVVVSFIIDKIGKVTQAKIVKSLNEECDKEALRVISEMPDWIPGEKDGKKVDVLFSLPINFD
jgi:TonB family protein